jgi:hypothetical protein
MALVVPKITKDLEAAILNELKSVFGKEGDADPSSHQKIASAVAIGVAKVLIMALQSDAEVVPGQVTAGSPASQVTTTVGKIF